jgi:hypothetical protein
MNGLCLHSERTTQRSVQCERVSVIIFTKNSEAQCGHPCDVGDATTFDIDSSSCIQ